MSKTPEDYRNIVKILKLQLLKVREENATLSHQMGMISDSETSCNYMHNSAFTPKLNHYRQSEQDLAKKVVLFLEFAHRCELVGISPEMVFRISDKKRDKSVNSKNLGQVMTRLKLRMPDEQINKLVNTLSQRGSSIEYDDYLEYISAFQINSQKYPATSSRTYVQLCLLTFGQDCKKLFPSIRKLFAQIAQDNESYFKFDNFTSFCQKQCKKLSDVQIVAVFLGLDIQSLCRIQRQIFERQMDKIYGLIDRGLVDEKSLIQQKAKRSPVKKSTVKKDDEIQEYKEQSDDTGDQGFNKKKEAVQQKKKEKEKPAGKVVKNKLDKKISKDIISTLQKHQTSYGEFIEKLLQIQTKKTDIYYRSFSFNEFKNALLKTSGVFNNTTSIMEIFKKLDMGRNGSISTEELIKIFLRSDNDLADHFGLLYALFYRHLKEIQFPEPTTKFMALEYKLTDQVSEKSIKDIFQQLKLDKQEIEIFCQYVGSIKVEQFCKKIKEPPSISKAKQFEAMSKDESKMLADFISKLKLEKQYKSQFKKLIRNPQNKAENESDIWETIFQNELECFRYCYEKASKLNNYWRDHEFGPTKGDPNGLRAIIGNESKKPPCLPEDEDIIWMNHDQMLKKRKSKDKALFWNTDLKATDVVQGKLGDCWYVSALSTITLNDEYIKGRPILRCKKLSDLNQGIMPSLFRGFAKYGMYVFKFFKKFKPVYVIIDDLLPVQKSSYELIFAKSPQQKMQWVSFAEKAYAKLHHTYSNMISGDIAQGLNDLTNSLPIKEVLSKDENRDNKKIIENLKKLNKNKQLMGCSIKIPKQGKGDSSVAEPPYEYKQRRCGLLGGHAYSIIDCLSLNLDGGKSELVRVRNPWGNSEWLLEWSDTPLDDDPDCQQLQNNQGKIDEYYKDIKEPGPYIPGEDGEFLMPMEDWEQIFTNLFIGLNEGYALARRQFYYLKEEWGGDYPSGVCKSKGGKDEATKFVAQNHQYIMEISEPTEVLMLMSQEDGRLYRGQTYPYKEIVKSSIILVFDVAGPKYLKAYDKTKLVDPDRPLVMEARRDVSYWRTYDKGTYAIFPCRNQKSDLKNQFEFRIYSDKNIKLSKYGQAKSNFQKRESNILSSKAGETQISELVKFLQKNDIK